VDEDSSRRCDIVTSVAGLNLANACYLCVSPTDLITDVTLAHPFDSRHELEKDYLADGEARSHLLYQADYHAHNLAFAPFAHILVSKVLIFGQQGPDHL
jgi:hypothetical protein